MIQAFTLHLGVITVVVSVVLLDFNALMKGCGQASESARENYNILAGFLLVGGVLVAIGGVGLMMRQ